MSYTKLEGVKDLPIRVRGLFAKALMAEDQGDLEKAHHLLVKAMDAEAKELIST